MRLADAILRRGHLSERSLTEFCITGERPAHVDRCDICAERAVEMTRWLDEVRTAGLETADAEFPQERLAAQQSQIMRRLEQLDHPARVIAFPGQARSPQTESTKRRIAPAWLGFAAAAGLVFGVVGGQITARLGHRDIVSPEAAQAATALASPVVEPPSVETSARVSAVDGSLGDSNLEWPSVPFLEAMDQLTPHAVDVALRSPKGGRR